MAALAGYTAAIIASDELGATGGPNADEVFILAVTRASEICIGIVCAGIVLAGTDLGGGIGLVPSLVVRQPRQQHRYRAPAGESGE